MPGEMPRVDDVTPLGDRLAPATPPDGRGSRRRWIRRVAWVAVVAGALGVAAFFGVRNQTSPVSVDDSLGRFRAAGASARRSAEPSLPAPGVYIYRTTGGDEVDALGGSRHVYPAETTWTVTVDGRGCAVSRWQPLGERWEEWVICRDGDRTKVRQLSVYHEFFAKGDRRDYFCGEDSLYRPVSDRPGSTFSSACVGSADRGEAEGTVLATERIAVGGERVPAVHLRITTRFGGVTDGVRKVDVWLHRDTSLPLRLISEDDLRTDSVLGRVHYRERYEIELTSLEPRT